jgi:hypothetical protein
MTNAAKVTQEVDELNLAVARECSEACGAGSNLDVHAAICSVWLTSWWFLSSAGQFLWCDLCWASLAFSWWGWACLLLPIPEIMPLHLLLLLPCELPAPLSHNLCSSAKGCLTGPGRCHHWKGCLKLQDTLDPVCSAARRNDCAQADTTPRPHPGVTVTCASL